MILSEIYNKQLNYHVLSAMWWHRALSPLYIEVYHANSSLIVICGLAQSIYVRPLSRCSPPYIQEATNSLRSTSIAAHGLQITSGTHPVVTNSLAVYVEGSVYYAERTAADAL